MTDAQPILCAEHLVVSYGDDVVLDDVSLTVRRGELWFLLGSNGAGKTTLLRALLGLIRPRRGSVQLATEGGLAEVGFVPQRCELNRSLPTTVRELVNTGLVGLDANRNERRERLATALAFVDLAGAETHSYWSLSGGQRQRALIARALIRQPQLLLLDEPTSNLDPPTQEAILKTLARINAERGLTVLVVTHDLSLASRYASHVALFHGGRLTAGRREEVLRTDNLRRIYGAQIEVVGFAGADLRSQL